MRDSYGGRCILIFAEAGDIRVQRGEVVGQVRVVTRYQQLTRDNTFLFDLFNRANAPLSPQFS